MACVGGLLHVMMPLSTMDPAKADRNAFLFVDTWFPRLLVECFKNGQRETRVAGEPTPKAEKRTTSFKSERKISSY
jgi:chemotaxis receptor (MCP) glutamine deamidase CheD